MNKQFIGRQWRVQGGSEVSTEPPFLAGCYKFDVYCERSRLHGTPLYGYTAIKLALAYLVSVFERVLV